MNPVKPEGILIASVSQDDKPGTSSINSRFYLKLLETHADTMVGSTYRIESREERFGGLIPGHQRSDFPEIYGRLVAINIPAGIYEFYSWHAYNDRLSISPKYAPPPLFVDVKAGELVYIGNLHMNISTGKNYFNMSVASGALPEVIDMSERDISLFKKRYPQFSDNNINKSVLNEGPWLSSKAISRTIHSPTQPVLIK